MLSEQSRRRIRYHARLNPEELQAISSSTPSTILKLLGVLLTSAGYALVDAITVGGIILVVTAFVAWLAKMGDPQTTAINIGLGVAGVTLGISFLIRVFLVAKHFYESFQLFKAERAKQEDE